MIVVHLLLSRPPSLNYGCLEDTCRPVPPNTALFSLSLQVLGGKLRPGTRASMAIAIAIARLFRYERL